MTDKTVCCIITAYPEKTGRKRKLTGQDFFERITPDEKEAEELKKRRENNGRLLPVII